MKKDPIAEIRDQLEIHEDPLKTTAEYFQIPVDVAERVRDLRWPIFQEYTGGFIDKPVWDRRQTLMKKEGVTALDGLRFGPTKIVVGDKYAVLMECSDKTI